MANVTLTGLVPREKTLLSSVNTSLTFLTTGPDLIKARLGDGTSVVIQGQGLSVDNGPFYAGTVTSISHYDIVDQLTCSVIGASLSMQLAYYGLFGPSYQYLWFSGDDVFKSRAVNPVFAVDRILAGDGNDEVHAGIGNDYVGGGRGDDHLRGDAGDDELDGGDINSAAWPSGNDNLFGGAGNDTMSGRDGIDILFGGTGNDVLSGGADDDELRGHDGDDRIDGGSAVSPTLASGADNLYGGAGKDYLIGRDGDDHLHGGAGDDALLGGEGADTLKGASGDDAIRGDAGDDLIRGGDGFDAAYYLAAFDDLSLNTLASQTIITTASEGVDTLSGVEALMTMDGAYAWSDVGQQWLKTGGAEQVLGDFEKLFPEKSFLVLNGQLLIKTYGEVVQGVIQGNSYADFLVGGTGNAETIYGAGGDDYLIGDRGDDLLDGGEGEDTAVFANNFSALKITWQGTDIVVASSEGTDTLRNIERIETYDGVRGWDALQSEWVLLT